MYCRLTWTFDIERRRRRLAAVKRRCQNCWPAVLPRATSEIDGAASPFRARNLPAEIKPTDW